jgi:hypothetical protein
MSISLGKTTLPMIMELSHSSVKILSRFGVGEMGTGSKIMR